MENYQQQTQRIIEKLDLARQKDRSFKVFGANSHKYQIGMPIDNEVITNFEQEYNLDLPNCYKAFLTQVGNGNNIKGFRNSAAGPFYGIYPFASNIDELIENPKPYLQKECRLFPLMTDRQWDELIGAEDDEVYDEWLGNLFAGILPIGSQGCTYIHGLVLNGIYKGKVVNLDLSIQKPHFCFEDNFLDWYERWLDEIISGDLTVENAGWFGYNKGGTEKSLIAEYKVSDLDNKKNCLVGLLEFKAVSNETFQFIEKEYQNCGDESKHLYLHILAKFNYDKAKKYLFEYANKNPLTVFQAVYCYHRNKSNQWFEFIESNTEIINDLSIFDCCLLILKETKRDYSHILVLLSKNKNPTIRAQSLFMLGKQTNKSKYKEVFINGLYDSSESVVHRAIQSFYFERDVSLIKHLKKVYIRFGEKSPKILYFIKAQLKGLNLSLIQLKELSSDELKKITKIQPTTLKTKTKKKWYQFRK